MTHCTGPTKLEHKYVNMALNVHRNRKAYWGRGEGGGEAKGGMRGEGDYIPVATLSPPTTRMTPALRWTAMRVILIFHNCEGQSHKTVSTDINF